MMTIELSTPQALRHEPQMFSAKSQKATAAPQSQAAEVGFFLKRERLKFALSLSEVADATGIHHYHLEAMETGNLTNMPKLSDAMEMMATYAQFLGFEPEPLVEHLVSVLPASTIAPKVAKPEEPSILSSAKVMQFGKMPKKPIFKFNLAKMPGGPGAVLASVAFAAFMLYAGAQWVYPSQLSSAQQEAAAQVATVDPMATASTTPEAPIDANAQNLEQAGKIGSLDAGQPDADALNALIQNETGNTVPDAAELLTQKGKKPAKMQDRILPDGVQQASSETSPQQASSAGRVFGAENKDARVSLRATAPVWLRIEDQQGIAVMTQMLNTGDIFMVPNREGLVALSRDGGRLAFAIDGKDKGMLGPPGKILVSERLDIEALNTKKVQASSN